MATLQSMGDGWRNLPRLLDSRQSLWWMTTGGVILWNGEEASDVLCRLWEYVEGGGVEALPDMRVSSGGGCFREG